MEEIWINTGNEKLAGRGYAYKAISNLGRIMKNNGEIFESHLRQKFRYNGKVRFVHQFIAEHFIPKTDEDIALGRDCIDHITHNPIGMNINDVRNLRWCTKKENLNFPEAKLNIGLASKEGWRKRKSKS